MNGINAVSYERSRHSNDKALLSLAQARDWVIEAGSDCDVGAIRSALMAAYMGYFHAARAILFRDGVREKSHYCIGVYLEYYCEKKMLEDEWYSFLITCGHCDRAINTVLKPDLQLRKSGRRFVVLKNLSNAWISW